MEKLDSFKDNSREIKNNNDSNSLVSIIKEVNSTLNSLDNTIRESSLNRRTHIKTLKECTELEAFKSLERFVERNSVEVVKILVSNFLSTKDYNLIFMYKEV